MNEETSAILGEIRLAAFDAVPNGWAQCNGQLLSINDNQNLYSLIGNQFGGDGQTTFALPDLRGRVPVHQGVANSVGSNGGEELHTLTTEEIPAHTHIPVANPGTPDQTSPAGGFWGVPLSSGKVPGPTFAYAGSTNLVPLAANAIGPSPGSGTAHENRSPYLVLNFIICLSGIYPSQDDV